MWSCSACAIRMRLRMYCALSGISSFNASSTERTLAMACTVVQTPQKRCVNIHASRGSRPRRIFSMPRHMVHDAHASLTALLSTSTSTRRWPSILVMGSIVNRAIRFNLQTEFRKLLSISGHILFCFFRKKSWNDFALCLARFHLVPQPQRRGKNGQHLGQKDEDGNADRHESHGNQQLDHAGKINRIRLGLKCCGRRIESVEHSPYTGNQGAGKHRPQIAFRWGAAQLPEGNGEKCHL